MLKRHRLLAATAAVAASAAVALAGLAAASASPARPAASRTEHFQLVTTSPSGSSPVIMYGVILGFGTDHEGSKIDTMKFPAGSFRLVHHETKGAEPINPKNCLDQVYNDGTYKISGGTGKYKGISGHGTYHFTQLYIFKKVKGLCRTNLPPFTFQQIIYASGPLKR